MGHPYWIPDQDMFSNCCGALSAAEIVDGIALCSACGEHAEYYEERMRLDEEEEFQVLEEENDEAEKALRRSTAG